MLIEQLDHQFETECSSERVSIWGVTLRGVLIDRCPRCRAEDISADAHPTRILDGGRLVPFLVCRTCYRAAELELRIACGAADIPYEPMPIREGLRLLADFYLDRLADQEDPDLLADEGERRAATARVQSALDEIRRRLAIEPVPDA